MTDSNEQLAFSEGSPRDLDAQDAHWIVRFGADISPEARETINFAISLGNQSIAPSTPYEQAGDIIFARQQFFDYLGASDPSNPIFTSFQRFSGKVPGLMEPFKVIRFARILDQNHINPARVLSQSFLGPTVEPWKIKKQIDRIEQLQVGHLQAIESCPRLLTTPAFQFEANLKYLYDTGCDSSKIARENPQALCSTREHSESRIRMLEAFGLDAVKTVNCLPSTLTASDNQIIVRIKELETEDISRSLLKKEPFYLTKSAKDIQNLKIVFTNRKLDYKQFFNKVHKLPQHEPYELAEKIDNFMSDCRSLGLTDAGIVEVLELNPKIIEHSIERNHAISVILRNGVSFSDSPESAKLIGAYFKFAPETLLIALEKNISLASIAELRKLEKQYTGIQRQRIGREQLANGTTQALLGFVAAQSYFAYVVRRDN